MTPLRFLLMAIAILATVSGTKAATDEDGGTFVGSAFIILFSVMAQFLV